ncbi:hypothetical protein BC567DRAFT_252154 [Phyllosticta citribraziliensis]
MKASELIHCQCPALNWKHVACRVEATPLRPLDLSYFWRQGPQPTPGTFSTGEVEIDYRICQNLSDWHMRARPKKSKFRVKDACGMEKIDKFVSYPTARNFLVPTSWSKSNFTASNPCYGLCSPSRAQTGSKSISKPPIKRAGKDANAPRRATIEKSSAMDVCRRMQRSSLKKLNSLAACRA